MGVFRKHKAKHYSVDKAKRQAANAKRSVRQLAEKATDQELNALLYEWAEWEELVARLQNRNDSDVV